MEDLSDPCTVWDNVRVCYVTRTELEARRALYSLSPPTQQPLVSPVRFQWSQSPSRNDSQAPPAPAPPGNTLPSALKLNKSTPASSLVQPRSRASQAQKAFWNKNGSITVMEVCQPQATKIKATKKISWPDPQPEKLNRIRTLSETFSHNKIKSKIQFPPSSQLAERKKKKGKPEDRPALMTRNFTWRGKKVLNLGDTEAASLHAENSDLLVPDIEW